MRSSRGMAARRRLAAVAGVGLVALVLEGGCGTGWTVMRWRDSEFEAVTENHAEHEYQVRVVTTDGRLYLGPLRAVREDALVIRENRRSITIPAADIQELEIETPSVALTVFQYVGMGLIVAAVVALAMKTSCPFVYLLLPDGSAVLVSETYSGAVLGALERDDLVELPVAAEGPIRLRLASEAHEVHYTDKAVLWVVPHGAEARAVATHEAGVLLVGAPAAAAAVEDLDGADQAAAVGLADGQVWQTDMDAVVQRKDAPTREGLVARFETPPEGPVVLEVLAANTTWQDAVAGHLWTAMGHRIDDLQARWQAPEPDTRARLEAWRRRAGMDLQVEVDDGTGWRTVGWVPPQGWAATRHFAVPLGELSGPAQVRVSGGVGFWLVDHLALAPVVDDAPAAVELRPEQATSWDGRDERAALAASDGLRQVLPDQGTWVDLGFTLPEEHDGGTVFLATRGYYEVLPRTDARPDRRTLARLALRPEEAGNVSLELWRRWTAGWGHVRIAWLDEAGP